MPDLENTPEPGELDTPADAQGANAEAPPWGDDFDASKAWGTITKQRESEKELKERLRRLEEDDEAFADLARKRGYEIDANEDVPDEEPQFEEDDPIAPLNERLARAEQWQQQQDAKAEKIAIQADIDRFNANSDWELDGHDRAVIEAWARSKTKGDSFTPEHLEQAYGEYIAREELKAARAVERAKKPKPKVPATPPSGQAATEVLDLDDPKQRHRWMAEQLQGGGT